MNLVYKALQKIPVPRTLPLEVIPPSKRKITNSPTTPPLPKAGDNKSTEAAVIVPPAADVKSKSEPTMSWVVTAHAKAQCDELFTKTDTDKDGFVSGAEIKKIFIKSGLPQPVLARIWSLCDTKNLGKLNRDQFALAMYLIQQKVKGVELPSKLTPEMVPPSARRNSLGDNVPPPGVVFDMSTPGMKEIENLGNEIEQVKSLKQTLEGEKVAVEESIKALETSMMSMQQEIDVVVNAVKQLNIQKTEAQKRLDDLDTNKHQMEKDAQEMEAQHEQMQKKIVDLKDQLANRDNLNKTMEEDLKSKRVELNVLRQQELEMELKFEASHRRLVQLSKLLHGSQVQIAQIQFNIEKLSETRKQVMLSSHLYDRMLNNEITEQEAMSMGSLTITSPTLNFDLSSFDAMSDMVLTTNEEMDEFQAKLSELQRAGDDLDVEDEEQEESVEMKVEDKVDETEEPWDDVPFAKAQAAKNDPFAIGFVTEVKSPINPEDPFGQGAFAPPGAKPARPSRPPQLKQSSGGTPPSRPKSPVPPRPKSPAPPGRPKSPAKSPARSPKGTPPSRPPAPSKSPNPPSDEEDSFFSQIRGNSESNFADFPSDKFASDYDLK